MICRDDIFPKDVFSLSQFGIYLDNVTLGRLRVVAQLIIEYGMVKQNSMLILKSIRILSLIPSPGACLKKPSRDLANLCTSSGSTMLRVSRPELGILATMLLTTSRGCSE
jgi:hypothetical protein